MTNIVLFGCPGAGKGTQAKRLESKYNLMHISTGDVFRSNIQNETALGKKAKTYMDEGHLVPDDVTIEMLRSEVEKNKTAKGFIFDGFPRTISQAEALDGLMAEKDAQVDAMIALKVDEKILIKRLKKRGETSGRNDDNDEDIIHKRIQVYYEQTDVVKDYYQKKDKFYQVDGEGSIDEITKRLSRVIEKLK